MPAASTTKSTSSPKPASLTAVLGVVYRTIAVTLIQRFGSALNLNIHFNLLMLDGVYVRSHDRLEFHRVPPPTKAELD